MNEADIGMMASVNTNKLSLLKLKSFNLWFTENTLNVFMEIDVWFIDDLKFQVRPYRNELKELNVVDDYLVFTSGKVADSENMSAKLQIFKKKVLAKDGLVCDKILNEGEL